MKLLRTIAAILTGYALIAATLRLFATDIFLLAVTRTILGAIVAGFITALIAGSHEIPHAAAVGFLMIVMTFVAMRQQAILQPSLYQLAVAGCGPIACMIGAALRLLTKPAKTEKPRAQPTADNPPSPSPQNPSAPPH